MFYCPVYKIMNSKYLNRMTQPIVNIFLMEEPKS